MNANLGSAMKMTTNSNIEELTESINRSLENIISLNNDGRRMSRHNSIKADQKTVLNLISTFLGAFDVGFDTTKLEIEDIPEIFRLLKYPGNVSKNLFNPVGAKHTWGQCLNVINWLGQLASYYAHNTEFMRNHITIDWEIENLIIEGYVNGNLDTTRL